MYSHYSVPVQGSQVFSVSHIIYYNAGVLFFTFKFLIC